MHEWKPHDTSARKHVLKVLTAPILLQSFTLTTSLECPHQMLPVPIGHERVFHASRVKGFCRDSACPGSGAITVLIAVIAELCSKRIEACCNVV